MRMTHSAGVRHTQNYKNIFPLSVAKAHAAAIPDRPPQKRHCTKCCAAAPPFCFMHKFRRKIPCIFWKGNDTLSMEHSTEVLYNRTMVYCTPEHRFGSDALLLARFCEPKRSQKAADLCSGCGIVALEWHDRGHRGPCTALELQPEGSALLAAAVEEQQLTHITPVCADLRTWRQDEGQFDVCACNPPYFTEGPQSQNAAHALARHENTCALEDVCACGFRLLKDGGRLALCHRPERLAEVLAVLRAHRLEPKRLAFVKNAPENAPWLFLVEAQKNRKTGLRVEPDVLIRAGAALYGR